MSSLMKTLIKIVEDGEVIPSDAQTAVSADSMAFANKNTLTHSHVRDHLKAADEAAEEVDTQTFGIETDDGDIIKVYVAVADADNFEKALGKKLGEEDDVETVLDELADQFDIVDVKWPEEEEEEGDPNFGADKEEIQYDIEQDKPKENSDNAEAKLNSAIDTAAPESDEKEPEAAPEKKGGKGKKEEPETPEEPDESEEKPKKGGKSKKKDKDEEESEDEEPKPEEKPKKGGKGKKKEETTKESFDGSFLQNIINENSMQEVHFADHDMAKLYRETSNRQQRLLIELLAALGIPGDVLLQKHSTFKMSLRDAANDVLENSHLRVWLKKFVDAAKEFIEPVDESVEDELHASISGKLAGLAYKVAQKLGLSERIVQSKGYTIKRSIRMAVKKIANNSKAKIALLMIANALGVSDGTSHSDVVTAEEDYKLKITSEKELKEDGVSATPAQQGQAPKQYLGTSIYAGKVQHLLLSLGIPEENLQYQDATLMQSFNKKMQSVQGLSEVMSKIDQLIQLLDGATVEDYEGDEMSKAELLAGSAKKHSKEDNSPADLGDWSIGRVSEKITMKCGDFSVELTDDEDNMEKLVNALGEGNMLFLRSNGKRITFRPTNRGHDFVVKVADDQEFPNGVLLDSDSIDRLLDVIGQKSDA